jgi:UDP-glucose 4-epimerase
MSLPSKVGTPVVVVGGSGFIGGALVRRLSLNGLNVRGFSRHRALELESLPGVTWICGSLSDSDALDAAFEKAEVCYHLACSTVPRTSNADPVEDVRTNLLGTVHLLSRAARAGVQRIIYVSSGGTVYGTPRELPIPETHPLQPISSYGIVKATIEQYLGLFKLRDGLEYVILRVSNPFGPGQRADGAQGVIATFLYRILNELPIRLWGDGSAVRDFVYIDDLVEALVAAMTYQNEERIFNIGAGEGHTLADIIRRIEEVTGHKAAIMRQESNRFDVHTNILCIERARSALGYEPRVDLTKGLRMTAGHFVAPK